MAKLFTVKRFVAGGTYHIFNRGHNKQPIFRNDADYWAFRRAARQAQERCDFEVEFIVFCLLSNHYHFEVVQKTERAITRFMRSLMCCYANYLMKKYGREGSVCCGIYCAKLLTTQEEIDQVKNYILSNPIEAGLINWKHVGTKI